MYWKERHLYKKTSAGNDFMVISFYSQKQTWSTVLHKQVSTDRDTEHSQ